MKLALGTVQFGLSYGVANAHGKVPEYEAALILERARDLGIDTLDTAAAYGQSEDVLGRIGVSDFKLVSKLPPLTPAQRETVQRDPAGWVEACITESLTRLNRTHLDALLFHRPEDAFGSLSPDLWAGLTALQNAGVIRRLGISIYGPEDLDLAPPDMLETLPLHLIQAPANALDTRLEDSAWGAWRVARGCGLHTRSTFLQGLLLMSDADRPTRFSRWAAVWHAWQAWQDETGLSAIEAALFCALHSPRTERVLVGVDSLAQLDQIATAAAHVTSLSALDRPRFQGQDQTLLTPMTWTSL